jgi:hypothetical protein
MNGLFCLILLRLPFVLSCGKLASDKQMQKNTENDILTAITENGKQVGVLF